MINLAPMILTAGMSWGIGRTLDVLVKCFNCDYVKNERIANVQKNELGCYNCGQEYVQFTNACDFTVSPDRNIAHVGAIFRGGFGVDVDPVDSRDLPGWLFFYTSLRMRGFMGKQVVVKGELQDYDGREVFSEYSMIYPLAQPDVCFNNERQSLPVRWDSVPVEYRDERIFAVDLKILSKYGDLLFQERYLTHIWK